MALKESALGRQPATNLGFFFLLLCLDVCYYCSNIIVSLFFSFVPSYSLLSKSCDMLSSKTILSMDIKIRIKSPDHLFDLNCFDSMVYTIMKLSYVQSFLI